MVEDTAESTTAAWEGSKMKQIPLIWKGLAWFSIRFRVYRSMINVIGGAFRHCNGLIRWWKLYEEFGFEIFWGRMAETIRSSGSDTLERKPPGKNKYVIVRVVRLRFWSQCIGMDCSTVCGCGLSFLDIGSDGGSSLFSCGPCVQFERGMGLPGDVVGVQDGSALRTSQRPGHCQIWLVAQCALVGPLLETTPADDVLTRRHGKSTVWFLFEA